jgi:hypothetical protein
MPAAERTGDDGIEGAGGAGVGIVVVIGIDGPAGFVTERWDPFSIPPPHTTG